MNCLMYNEIKDLFPEYRTGRPPKNNRMTFNAVFWIARSGAAWRDLPKERHAAWKTVYSRFCLWRDTGLLESLFIALNCEADYENLSIDSTVITAHQQCAMQKKGAEFCYFATRYDKLATSYLAFVYVAAIFLLTK